MSPGRFAILVLVLACLASGTSTAASGSSRPNILFIMSDDHAVQALGAYGHAISRLAPTPNIDRIAREGILFRQSFVTNSLCGPSRAAMLTGKYGHVNGFRRNGDHFDGSQPTWPRMLKAAGYRTAVVGKWHINQAPHRNWMPPLRHARRFEDTQFPVPATYFDDYAGRKAAALQEMMNIDYAPTFLELAGLPVPKDIQGVSLAGILAGERPAHWHDAIYYQYFEYPGFHSVRAHYGVRSERYKLIRFYGDIDAWEFFDLERDPAETHNRIDDPGYRVAVAALKNELQSLRTLYRVPGGETG